MMKALLAAALAASCGTATAAPGRKMAVTDVRNVQGVAPGTATILSDIIVSEVARSGWRVISQSDISAMLGFEKQKKILGCSEDSSCLAEIGGALGVDYILAGQVGQIGSRFRISLLLVDANKADVAARAAQFCDKDEDALARTAESTVREILGAVEARGPVLAARAEVSKATSRAELGDPAAPLPGARPRGGEEVEPVEAVPMAVAGPSVARAAPTSRAGALSRSPWSTISSPPFWYAGVDLSMVANVGMGKGTSYGSGLDERSSDEPFGVMVRGGWRRTRQWALGGAAGFLASRSYERPGTSTLPGIGLDYAILSVGANAAWIPAGNRWFSIGAGAGLAVSRVHAWLTYDTGATDDAWAWAPGPFVSLELRAEYPIGPVRLGAEVTELTTVTFPDATVENYGAKSYFNKGGVFLYPLLAGLSLQYAF